MPSTSTEQFLCPRRNESPSYPGAPEHDQWITRAGLRDQVRGCSWCGSMHPVDFMDAVRNGTEIGPTDKSYKAYVGDVTGKFYFQHLPETEREEFFRLYVDQKINVGYPGHFYTLPFFIKPA